MSRVFLSLGAAFLFGATLTVLHGEDQVNALIVPPNYAEENGDKLIAAMLPYLDEGQRAEFEKALYAALEKDPALKSDGVALMREGGKKDASGADLAAYKTKLAAYEARLRQAMMVEDPAAGKIFDRIDAHLKLQ